MMKLIVRTKTLCLACFLLIPFSHADPSGDSPSVSGEGETGMQVSSSENGESILTFSVPRVEDLQEKRVKVTFTLPEGKGLLGPSSDSASQKGFSNKKGTVFAVNHQPVSKSSYVYLFLKQNGGIQMIGDVNERIAQLLPATRQEPVENFLQVEKIEDRILTVRVVDFFDGGQAHTYQIKIGEQGTLSRPSGSAP